MLPTPGASARPSPLIEASKLQFVEAVGQLGPGPGTLIVDIQPPPGAKLTKGSPLVVRAAGQDLVFPKTVKEELDPAKLPLRLPVVVADGARGPARVDLSYYYCTTGEQGSCRPERARLEVRLDLTGSGDGGEAHFSHRPIL
jgi:hypothetical protein